MQIILLERVPNLGQMGQEVSVKDGYARNYLLPAGKAIRATEANRKRFETERAQLEARNLDARKEAETVADKLNGQSFIIIRSASDTGALYGSVNTRDVAQLVVDGGFTVNRQQVVLNNPIKALGLHEIQIRLHPEVEVNVTINVARSDAEAEAQARGEDVLGRQDEDDDILDVTDLLEDPAALETSYVDTDQVEDQLEEDRTEEGR